MIGFKRFVLEQIKDAAKAVGRDSVAGSVASESGANEFGAIASALALAMVGEDMDD